MLVHCWTPPSSSRIKPPLVDAKGERGVGSLGIPSSAEYLLASALALSRDTVNNNEAASGSTAPDIARVLWERAPPSSLSLSLSRDRSIYICIKDICAREWELSSLSLSLSLSLCFSLVPVWPPARAAGGTLSRGRGVFPHASPFWREGQRRRIARWKETGSEWRENDSARGKKGERRGRGRERESEHLLALSVRRPSRPSRVLRSQPLAGCCRLLHGEMQWSRKSLHPLGPPPRTLPDLAGRLDMRTGLRSPRDGTRGVATPARKRRLRTTTCRLNVSADAILSRRDLSSS